MNYNGIQTSLLRPLTEFDILILRALARGALNREIAMESGESVERVKMCMKSLLRRLRLRNRTQAAVWAYRQLGMVTQKMELLDQCCGDQNERERAA